MGSSDFRNMFVLIIIVNNLQTQYKFARKILYEGQPVSFLHPLVQNVHRIYLNISYCGVTRVTIFLICFAHK